MSNRFYSINKYEEVPCVLCREYFEKQDAELTLVDSNSANDEELYFCKDCVEDLRKALF